MFLLYTVECKIGVEISYIQHVLVMKKDDFQSDPDQVT